jgi:hypothetical protein
VKLNGRYENLAGHAAVSGAFELKSFDAVILKGT